MDITGISAVVTGGASGLGLATVRRLLDGGAASVVIADLENSAGGTVAKELGDRVRFVPADVRDEAGMTAVLDTAAEAAAQQGRWQDAIRLESTALKLQPGDRFMLSQLDRFKTELRNAKP